jgi:hypothetical protein
MGLSTMRWSGLLGISYWMLDAGCWVIAIMKIKFLKLSIFNIQYSIQQALFDLFRCNAVNANRFCP